MNSSDFVAFVRERHPDAEIEVFDDGWDHVVVRADDVGYRFVRDEADREATFEAEAALLERLAPSSPMRVPELELGGDDEYRFARFEFISGVPLAPSLFETLAPAVQAGVARDLGAFLSHLHSVPVAEARAIGLVEDADMFDEWFERARSEIAPLLSTETNSWIDGLLAHHLPFAPWEKVVIHNDMAWYHVLFDPELQRVSGVIDFADAAIGDPARDFMFEAPYGREVLDAIHDAYSVPRSDEFDARRLLLEVRIAIFDLKHAMGWEPEHSFGRPNEVEASRLIAALERMRVSHTQ